MSRGLQTLHQIVGKKAYDQLICFTVKMFADASAQESNSVYLEA